MRIRRGPAPGERGKLGYLLACLLAASAALLLVHGPWLGLGEGLAGTRPCWARAPAVASVPPTDLARLRARVDQLVSASVGRRYETGYTTTPALWWDEHPTNPARATGDKLPAAYEVRWWALDRHGDEDDVVVDVLEYSSAKRAREAMSLAVSPSCERLHQQTAGPTGTAPTGARDISWTNPDKAHQWDSMLVRGRLLYRVSDDPAWSPSRREARALGGATDRTIDALACTLPGAGCPGAGGALAHSALAIGGHSRIAPGALAAPTRRQAAAFARAVNLKRYDVPWLAPADREGLSRERESAGSCAGKVPLAAEVLAMHSPTFAASHPRRLEQVSSGVTVLHSEALAARAVTDLASAASRACVAARFRAWLARFARRRSLRAGAVRVLAVHPQPPQSYRGSRPYLATAVRVALELDYPAGASRTSPVSFGASTNTGGVVPVYSEALTIAYGRAVVTLRTFGLPRPYFPESRRYLERMLLGRAEAFGG